MIVELLDKVDRISQQFVFNGYQQLADTYAPAIYGLVALCVIVYGYAVAQGWVSLSLAETSKRLLTVGFVISLALDWGIFSKYVYNLFTNAPNEISSILIKAIPNSHYSDVSGINSALQQAWYDGISFVAALWDRGDWHHWFPFFWAIVIFLLVLLLVGISLIELIVAKFGLAIFLVIAPLTIPMVLFKATKEVIFDGWLKHLVAFAFVPIFVTSSLALGLTLLSDSVIDIQKAISADILTITATAPYVIYIFVCIGLVVKATHMAASIANGFTAGMTPYVARAVNSIRQEVNKIHPLNFPIKNKTQPVGALTPVNPSTVEKIG